MPNLSIPLHHMPTYFLLLSESVFSSIAVFINVVLNIQHVFLVLYGLKKYAYKGLVLKYFPGGGVPPDPSPLVGLPYPRKESAVEVKNAPCLHHPEN